MRTFPDRVAGLRTLAPSLAWGLGLWLVVVVLPLLLLWPDYGPTQPVQWGLCALTPVGLLFAGMSGQPLAVLGFGLLCLMPALVACPELLGPRATGPLHALLVAVLVVGLVASTWRASWAPTTSPHRAGGPGLTRLWSRPRGSTATLTVAWGLLALALAWRLPELAHDDPEHVRAIRVAAAAVGWMALRRMAVADPGPLRRSQLVMRAVGVLGLLGLWWLWRQTA